MRNYKKTKNLILTVLLGFACSISSVLAQESINAAGGEATGSGGTISYTIGQVFFSSHQGENGSITEGMQQSYEITVLTSLEDLDIQLKVVVYPNPTTDYLNLIVDNIELSTLNFQLFDNTGRVLQKGKITEKETNIAMSALVPAAYFVRVIQGNAEVKTFKVIKK